MAHPMLSAIDGFERPPQLLRVDHQIPLDIGERGVAQVTFVIHEKDENGTTLRVEEIHPGEGSEHGEGSSGHKAVSGSPRTGTSITIVPSPSA